MRLHYDCADRLVGEPFFEVRRTTINVCESRPYEYIDFHNGSRVSEKQHSIGTNAFWIANGRLRLRT